MIAGAVAGLLVARGPRAAEDPESTPGATTAPSDPAPAGAEGARPQSAAPGADEGYGTGSGSAGAGAGDPASPSDAGDDAVRARASAADRAAQDDARQVAAGNTGGRG
jgi:hypothetical protein